MSDLVSYACEGALFALAETDADVPRAAALNQQAGFYARACDPALICNKAHQHAVVGVTDPALAFEGWTIRDASALPVDPSPPVVVRPTYSFSSKGSALILDRDRRPSEADWQHLARDSAGFQLHRYLPGRPIFVNGVISGSRFSLADCWRCRVMTQGCRDILVSVVNLPRAHLPKGLSRRLGHIASALGIDAGPVHFELVETGDGVKFVKCAPRLATEPLPGLCRLAGIGGQTALLEAGLACGFKNTLPDSREPEVFVADYSFVVSRSGFLLEMAHADTIRNLPSFDHTALDPPLGQTIAATCDGYSYGATFFLRHRDEAVIDADIETLDAMNRAGPFRILVPEQATRWRRFL